MCVTTERTFDISYAVVVAVDSEDDDGDVGDVGGDDNDGGGGGDGDDGGQILGGDFETFQSIESCETVAKIATKFHSSYWYCRKKIKDVSCLFLLNIFIWVALGLMELTFLENLQLFAAVLLVMD
ncbi:unnamed protein product [Enterobius vermicularis]|uniref:Uncharacterized protein n=1 Tax=Enterobius vermicularis TaxID=51028 RepID=A0A0N4V3D7_ENTVE|nr:unnamed protein product [Enterobius vermicularis]